ncbi:thermonuclease family protein [Pseudomonas sp. N040]|uniref:thermonuclease family protein n=1 Tax=Pseudomonas sp. N040 TaxID=2785325 RepID=UPI001E494509|nr:thermonuclease family protein [Pseudomonas sp. N040]
MGAFFIGLLGCIAAQASCPLPGKLPTYRVERVVDGDTLRLMDGRSVRLVGLNTPELAHQGRPVQPFAHQAQQRLQQLVVANDSQVALQVGVPAKDHYGRTLAHVYDRQGRNLEQQLLAEGLGYQVAFAPETALVDCQRAAERQARQSARGLWRRPDILAPGQVRAGGFALIHGQVLKIERNRGGLWLDLGSSLVLQVKPKLFSQFDIQALQKLSGREVEVRGWVVDRARRGQTRPGQARWLLSLTSPVMLEVLQ